MFNRLKFRERAKGALVSVYALGSFNSELTWDLVLGGLRFADWPLWMQDVFIAASSGLQGCVEIRQEFNLQGPVCASVEYLYQLPLQELFLSI